MNKIPILFKLMEEKKVTQQQLSKAIGVSQGNISDWRSGRGSPNVEVLPKIANYFNVSIDYLLGRTDNPQLHGLPLSNPVVEYEECYVAFLDVIGYRDFVEDKDNDAKYIRDTMKKITKPIEENDWEFLEELKDCDKIKQEELHYNFFSDSMVLSIRKDVPHSLFVLLFTICDFEIDCLINCPKKDNKDKKDNKNNKDNWLLIRGGITEGKMYCKNVDRFAFGEAMNKAYKLESETAVAPRVIVSKELLNAYLQNASEKEKSIIDELLNKKETDGYLFVDYLNLLLNVRQEGNNPNANYANKREHMKTIEEVINKGLDKLEEGVRKKYIWLNKYYNEIVGGEYVNDLLKNRVANDKLLDIPMDYILKSKGKEPKVQIISENARELLDVYNQFNERKQLLVLGYVQRMLDENKSTGSTIIQKEIKEISDSTREIDVVAKALNKPTNTN